MAIISLAACPLAGAWSGSQARPTVRQVRTRREAAPEEALRYFGPKSTPLLDSIANPSDLKRLTIDELKQLSYELRWDVLNSVSKTGLLVSNLFSSVGQVIA